LRCLQVRQHHFNIKHHILVLQKKYSVVSSCVVGYILNTYPAIASISHNYYGIFPAMRLVASHRPVTRNSWLFLPDDRTEICKKPSFPLCPYFQCLSYRLVHSSICGFIRPRCHYRQWPVIWQLGIYTVVVSLRNVHACIKNVKSKTTLKCLFSGI